LFQPWQGTFFRFQSISFPAPGEVLSGEGARRRGGRWNPPGQAALYGSLTDTAALEECKANDRYYGVESKAPRLLIAIEAELTGLVDLTSGTVRRALGVTLSELAREDWRKLLHAGKESSSQVLGRAAAACGASGLLTQSAATPGETNLVAFPKARHQTVSGSSAKKNSANWASSPALDTSNIAGFYAGIIMTSRTKTRPAQTKQSRVASFRFSHRGAHDYTSLLLYYRDTFNLPQPLLVRLTGFSPRSVTKWSQGETPSAKQEKALVEMDRLLDGLSRAMEPAQVGRWLKQPNAAFDGSTPLQVVERGESDRIWHMLYDLESRQSA
jgi:RES domain-containing protein